jgi:hypothetical protein
MAIALAFAPAALADTTLCPNGGINGNENQWGWSAGGSGIVLPGPLDTDPDCGPDSAVQFYIPNITGYATLWWPNSSTGIDVGNIASVSASVVNEGADEPYYALYFTDPGGLSGGSVGDDIEMLEFEPSTLSGAGGDTLAIDPATTLFNVFDYSVGYIAGGQQNAMTLNEWNALDPSLSNVASWIGIQIGVAGGCDGPCSETLTINSVDYSLTPATPEPSSLWLFGTGALGLAIVAFRKVNPFGSISKP